MRILCIFSFLSFIDTLFLYLRSCNHLLTYIILILLHMWIYVFSITYPLHVLFLFSLYAQVSYYLYAIYYYFTQRCLDEFYLKCFKNTGCQNLLVINFLLAKFFRVCVKIDFIVFNK